MDEIGETPETVKREARIFWEEMSSELLANPTTSRVQAVMRARNIAPYFERGEVMLPAEAPWLAEFEAEVCGFPLAPHNDIVDATAYARLELTNVGDSFGEYLELLKEKLKGG